MRFIRRKRWWRELYPFGERRKAFNTCRSFTARKRDCGVRSSASLRRGALRALANWATMRVLSVKKISHWCRGTPTAVESDNEKSSMNRSLRTSPMSALNFSQANKSSDWPEGSWVGAPAVSWAWHQKPLGSPAATHPPLVHAPNIPHLPSPPVAVSGADTQGIDAARVTTIVPGPCAGPSLHQSPGRFPAVPATALVPPHSPRRCAGRHHSRCWRQNPWPPASPSAGLLSWCSSRWLPSPWLPWCPPSSSLPCPPASPPLPSAGLFASIRSHRSLSRLPSPRSSPSSLPLSTSHTSFGDPCSSSGCPHSVMPPLARLRSLRTLKPAPNGWPDSRPPGCPTGPLFRRWSRSRAHPRLCRYCLCPDASPAA